MSGSETGRMSLPAAEGRRGYAPSMQPVSDSESLSSVAPLVPKAPLLSALVLKQHVMKVLIFFF